MPAYRYWRLYITSTQAGDGYINMDDVELLDSIDGVDLTTPTTPVTGSSAYDSPYTAQRLVDAPGGGFWHTTSSAIHWAAFDLGSPKDVKAISMRGIASQPGRMPKDFKVQYSSDGATWTDVPVNIPPQTGWGAAERRVFALTSAVLSGVAKLDTGVAASLVLVYPWNALTPLFAQVVPAADGTWSAFAIPNQSYMVVIRGPTGYQPITHGPVLAVEP